MRAIHFRLSVLPCIFVALSAAGCGDETVGPETVPVAGKVTLDGTPVAQAVVSLTPAPATAESVPAQATTNDAGEFEVHSVFDQGRTMRAGMVPGEYTLTVTKLESIPAQAQLTRAPKNLLPTKYESVASSGLTAKVSADGENFIAIELKK
jgi:hypothetical protein